jgi:hypothetical protein
MSFWEGETCESCGREIVEQRVTMHRTMNQLAMLLRELGQYVEAKWPLNLLSALVGGVVGLLLVFVVVWIKKPRIRVRGFEKVQNPIAYVNIE